MIANDSSLIDDVRATDQAQLAIFKNKSSPNYSALYLPATVCVCESFVSVRVSLHSSNNFVFYNGGKK